MEKIPLSQFWPKGGPKWDALGRSSLGKLFLVEAKSHIPELLSSIKAEDRRSKERIEQSLEETKRYLNSKAKANWSQYFYQYTNRLAFLYLLRKNSLPAYLIHVYFLNDVEMNGPTSFYEWKGAIRLRNSILGIGTHKLQKFMIDLFVDVRDLH